MKAAQITQYGDSSNIVIQDAVDPSIKPNQVLVRVHAASLNPFDGFILSGGMQSSMPFPFPITLGGDFAGEVISIGAEVTDISVGAEVYGSANLANGGSGSLAQTLAANAINVATKPKSIDYINAAALPLVGASSVQALEEHINIQSGSKILIHGGAGGIGHIAIQLAKIKGAYVATTVSADDMEFVKKLDADQVIDYKLQKFDEILQDYDAVFDTIGGAVTDRSFSVLKKGGILVSMKGPPSPDLAAKFGVTVVGQATKTNTKHLSRLRELVDAGKVKVHVDHVFSLAQTKEAFDALFAHPKGKVVVTMV